MAAAAAAGAAAPEVFHFFSEQFEKMQASFNDQVINRDSAARRIMEHFRSAFPAYNCMVVHSQHLADFQESVHRHIEVKTSFFGTTGYEIYVFKRGTFTNLGDGGWINWAFGGNFQRDGGRVTFSDI